MEISRKTRLLNISQKYKDMQNHAAFLIAVSESFREKQRPLFFAYMRKSNKFINLYIDESRNEREK